MGLSLSAGEAFPVSPGTPPSRSHGFGPLMLPAPRETSGIVVSAVRTPPHRALPPTGDGHRAPTASHTIAELFLGWVKGHYYIACRLAVMVLRLPVLGAMRLVYECCKQTTRIFFAKTMISDRFSENFGNMAETKQAPDEDALSRF